MKGDLIRDKEKNRSPRQESNLFPILFHYRAQNSPSLFTYRYSWWLRQFCSLQYAGRLSHMNSVKWPCSPWFLVAQWIEPPPGVWEVMDSIPARNSDFFFVPCLCHVDQFTFHISLPRSKFIIFIHLSWRNLFINSKQNQKMIGHRTLFRENDDLPLSMSSRKEKAARALITLELMRRV